MQTAPALRCVLMPGQRGLRRIVVLVLLLALK
jgi:hypothetical protein